MGTVESRSRGTVIEEGVSMRDVEAAGSKTGEISWNFSPRECA